MSLLVCSNLFVPKLFVLLFPPLRCSLMIASSTRLTNVSNNMANRINSIRESSRSSANWRENGHDRLGKSSFKMLIDATYIQSGIRSAIRDARLAMFPGLSSTKMEQRNPSALNQKVPRSLHFRITTDKLPRWSVNKIPILERINKHFLSLYLANTKKYRGEWFYEYVSCWVQTYYLTSLRKQISWSELTCSFASQVWPSWYEKGESF